jgi:hypothetical protein
VDSVFGHTGLMPPPGGSGRAKYFGARSRQTRATAPGPTASADMPTSSAERERTMERIAEALDVSTGHGLARPI